MFTVSLLESSTFPCHQSLMHKMRRFSSEPLATLYYTVHSALHTEWIHSTVYNRLQYTVYKGLKCTANYSALQTTVHYRIQYIVHYSA